jgi:uncharacterized protein (TIGR02001 family)
MKKNRLLLIPALLLASNAAFAEVSFSGYASGTSNFMYRGVSLSRDSAAMQSQVSVKSDSGLYATLWGSNTSLGTAVTRDGPGLEGNVLFGLTKNITEDISYDVGYLRTFYPGVKAGKPGNFDFNDFYGSVSYKGFSAGVSYSDDYFGETGRAFYTYASYKAPVIDKLSLTALVGHTRNSSEQFLGLFGAPASNWTHYIIGLSHPLPHDLELSGEFHGVDSNGNDAFKLKGFGANRVVVSLTKNF